MNVTLTNSGVYKLQSVTDLVGSYCDAFLSVVIEKIIEDVPEGTVENHCLSKTFLNTIARSFDGGEIVKFKVDNTNSGKDFTSRIKFTNLTIIYYGKNLPCPL